MCHSCVMLEIITWRNSPDKPYATSLFSYAGYYKPLPQFVWPLPQFLCHFITIIDYISDIEPSVSWRKWTTFTHLWAFSTLYFLQYRVESVLWKILDQLPNEKPKGKSGKSNKVKYTNTGTVPKWKEFREKPCIVNKYL